MDSSAPQRRLAAILAADMVGYSRLIERDEAGTVARLKSDRKALIDPTIEAHGGRIVRLAGDGALIEFPSVVEAAQCAIDIQREMPKRNADRSEVERIVFRMGVNIGDILVEDDNLHGEGINVAARLESLCEPGGVLISEEAMRYVDGKVDAALEFVEERSVKNIERPVRIWRIRLDRPPQVGSQTAKRDRRRLIRKAAVPLGIVLITLVATLLWHQPWQAHMENFGATRTAFPLPDKPSIAVLPFDSLSDDPEQAFFADGITEDLTTDLSQIAGLFVIARNSAFAYRGKTVKPQEVARELGVRYLLEGSVRRVAEQVRINAQLIDASTANHVWAERYDGNLEELFAFQNTVTRAIISALAVHLTESEVARVAKHETDDPVAYLAFLRGWQHYRQRSADGYAKAVPEFDKAISRDPGFSRAHAALASTYWESWERKWHKSLGVAEGATLRDLSEHHLALAMKEPTSLAHQVLLEMHRQDDRIDDMVVEARRSVELDPNDPDSHIAMAQSLIFAGQPKEAIGHVEHAMRSDPYHPPFYQSILALAYLGLEQYERAASLALEALEKNPQNFTPVQALVSAYGHLGRIKEAQEAMTTYFPQLSTRWTEYYFRYKHPKDSERLISGMQLAGVPELAEGLPPPPED